MISYLPLELIKIMNAMSKISDVGFVYLVQVIRHGKKYLFKFGKTKKIATRFSNSDYSGHIVCYYLSRVKDCTNVEIKIKKAFKEIFTKADFGNEYYYGDPKIMVATINKIIDENNQRILDECDMTAFLKLAYNAEKLTTNLDFNNVIFDETKLMDGTDSITTKVVTIDDDKKDNEHIDSIDIIANIDNDSDDFEKLEKDINSNDVIDNDSDDCEKLGKNVDKKMCTYQILFLWPKK